MLGFLSSGNFSLCTAVIVCKFYSVLSSINLVLIPIGFSCMVCFSIKVTTDMSSDNREIHISGCASPFQGAALPFLHNSNSYISLHLNYIEKHG